MADSLYLNLWFPDFDSQTMLPHAVAAMRQFPFSPALSGITSLAIHPVSWNEATILEQRFRPGLPPEEAAGSAADMLHEDYAYVFEANWDLWAPQHAGSDWTLWPAPVRFIVRGKEFHEGESAVQGEVQVDFGLDTPFLHEELQLTAELESRVQANVRTLVDFAARVKSSAGASTHLLWSDSEESFAQKLVSRLQKVQ